MTEGELADSCEARSPSRLVRSTWLGGSPVKYSESFTHAELPPHPKRLRGPGEPDRATFIPLILWSLNLLITHVIPVKVASGAFTQADLREQQRAVDAKLEQMRALRA